MTKIMTYEEVTKRISALPKYDSFESLLEVNQGKLPKDSYLFVDNDFVAVKQDFVYEDLLGNNEVYEEIESHDYWTQRGPSQYTLADLLETMNDLEVHFA